MLFTNVLPQERNYMDPYFIIEFLHLFLMLHKTLDNFSQPHQKTHQRKINSPDAETAN